MWLPKQQFFFVNATSIKNKKYGVNAALDYSIQLGTDSDQVFLPRYDHPYAY